MFFQVLFKQPKKEKLEICPAEKLLILVRELLNKELPAHYSQHHILYTANTKLESLNSALEWHRTQGNLQLKLGQFHSQTHDQLRKQASDLQALVDGYMELNIDMTQMNHRLHFHYEEIHYIHENYVLFKEGRFSNQSSQLFWQAVKEDVLSIIRKIL
ncbi:hypothetical protein [Ureibacillus chungkukjangi]|uniref:Uncharacterized protein n=1 Tax=Ureibacillus chungkukjangi TaxID=1202712 RepID=A0A318TXB9_9BACL|nr:hypothetical protein [Ureibacillus chungkukjangi]PYF04279.1 hypothetical protein BJ095_12428 [Ureibacillus chungkukjangi]